MHDQTVSRLLQTLSTSKGLDELPAYLVALAADLAAGKVVVSERTSMALWDALYEVGPTPTALVSAA